MSKRNAATAKPGRAGSPRTAGRRQGASEFLELLCEVSSRFVDVGDDRVDDEIRGALQRLLSFFAVDRCLLFRIRPGSTRAEVAHSVEREGLTPWPASLDAAELLPWLFGQLVGERRTVCFNGLDEFPDSATKDRESCADWGIGSALLVPLPTAAGIEYVIAVVATAHERRWSAPHSRGLHLLGEILVCALRRQAMAAAGYEALRFEQLIADLSSRFAGLPGDRVGIEIDTALAEVRAYFAVDQCGVFAVQPEAGEAYLVHLAWREGVVAAPMTVNWAAMVPWQYDRIVTQRQVVVMTRLDDFPPEAAVDRSANRAIGVLSFVSIPIVVDGAVRYVFSLAGSDERQIVPERLLGRLRLLGEVLVNALDRGRVTEARLRAETGLNEAQRIAHIGSWEWDIVADRISTSEELDRIFGVRLETSRGFIEAIHPSDRRAVQESFERHLAQPDGMHSVEYRIIRPDGGRRLLHERYEISFAADGKPVRAIGTIQDVTEARRNEQEIAELRANQWHSDRVARIGVIVASLAHELSQPLAAILSNAQAGLRLLADGKLDRRETEEILADIVADDKRAGEIIGALRNMLRRQKTVLSRVDVADTVGEVLVMVRSALLARQIDLETDLAPGCVVLADKTQIQQVALNLVTNSIDAMRSLPAEQHRLHVSVSAIDAQVCLAIRDSGVGIPDAQIDTVFEAFWSSKDTGLGLGLAICRSIVEAHSGRIHVEPNADRGVTFFVTLPMAAGGDSTGAP